MMDGMKKIRINITQCDTFWFRSVAHLKYANFMKKIQFLDKILEKTCSIYGKY